MRCREVSSLRRSSRAWGPPGPSPSPLGPQSGVTLIELLIVMIIIAILSVVIVVSMTAAVEDAESVALEDYRSHMDSILKQHVMSLAGRKHLVDINGDRISSCETPVYTGMYVSVLPDILTPAGYFTDDGCWQSTIVMTNGPCVDPDKVSGTANALTVAPCIVHQDCTGTWMGCGSFDGFTIRVDPTPACTGTHLPIEKTCNWSCESNRGRLVCGDWISP